MTAFNPRRKPTTPARFIRVRSICDALANVAPGAPGAAAAAAATAADNAATAADAAAAAVAAVTLVDLDPELITTPPPSPRAVDPAFTTPPQNGARSFYNERSLGRRKPEDTAAPVKLPQPAEWFRIRR